MEAEREQFGLSGQAAGQPEPDFSRSVKPIADLVDLPDFPRCALGEHVDIGGYTGVIMAIVNKSLKVRSLEGRTKSFNAGGLRRIYGRPAAPPAVPALQTPESPSLVSKPAPTVAPDFSKPLKPIGAFVQRPDYPQCVLGEHIEIGGYAGVVVQIVNRSLKVRSQAETTRSYNADALRRLHASH
jgi:hypothetical protein